MAGEAEAEMTKERNLIQETQRASRILLDEAVNTAARPRAKLKRAGRVASVR